MSDKKRNQKSNLKGCVYQGGDVELSPSQAEVYGYLLQGLTIAQISAKRKCSRAYVRKVRIQLRAKGLLSKMVTEGGVHPVTSVTKKALSRNLKRVHAQRFEFDILSFGPRFRPGLAQHLTGGTWVQCYDKKLVVYSAKDRVFSGYSLEEALEASIIWWRREFVKVENDLDVKILKPRRAFRVIYSEVASEGSSVAGSVIAKEGHVKVFSSEDGKLRLSFDMSKGRPEHEVHHSKTWHRDDGTADRHFNAILDYTDGPTLPELARATLELQQALKSQVDTLSVVIESLRRPEEALNDDWSEANYFG